jgi:hypothetical protein
MELAIVFALRAAFMRPVFGSAHDNRVRFWLQKVNRTENLSLSRP